jgi:hypothetical protein
MFDFFVDLIWTVVDGVANFTDADSPGNTIHGGPDDTDAWGRRPLDGHGNERGGDIWGNPNNKRTWW